MKPSELTGAPAPTWTMPHPASELADPPITAEDARAAETAVCRYHNGRIAHSPTTSDIEGRVLFCPVGGQYWRYSQQATGMYAPLEYRHERII